MQNYFNLDDIVYLTEEQDFEIKRSRLKEKDVLLTITGVSYGKSAVVPKEIEGANINQHSVKMELEGLSPYFLSTFLNSKIGKLQSDKYIVGVTRPALDYTSIKKFLIPSISEVFQQHIEDIILKAHMKRLDSQNLYSSAENYLLEYLGMTDFVANTENYNIKTLKESFLETGRIDSEYYLPKYENYQRIVENYSEGFAPCAKVCTIKEANYIPLDDKLYRYIELSNIGKSGEITGYDFQKGKDLPTRARRIVEQGDVIVSSIEGSLSSCALITKEYDQSLCSTGFYVLRSSVLNPETLLTLFKSFPLQQLMKKGCSGTILTAISKLELEQIPIPLIRPEVQTQIAQYIQESYALRKEAQQLLEEAKLSVERNIQMGGVKY